MTITQSEIIPFVDGPLRGHKAAFHSLTWERAVLWEDGVCESISYRVDSLGFNQWGWYFMGWHRGPNSPGDAARLSKDILRLDEKVLKP